MAALPKLIAFPERPFSTETDDASASDGATAPQREAQLEAALAKVRQRWGHGSIVRLDRSDVLAAAKPDRRRPKTEHELPPWWPRPLGPDGAQSVLRPRLLEVVAEPGSGRLTLALAWLAAARPALAAIVDTGVPFSSNPASAADLSIRGRDLARAGDRKSGDPRQGVIENGVTERFYPPAAVSAGLDPRQLVVVRPPPGDPRAPLDAVVILLRSEAFDVVLCPLPPRARVSTSFASKLSTFATRANTSLLLLSLPVYGADGYAPAHGGVLGAFADYRVRLGTRRWLWEDDELTGMKLRATTERARGASLDLSDLSDLATSDASIPATDVSHDLTFRLRPSARYGPSGANRFSLTTSVRILQQVQPEADQEVAVPLRLVASL